VIIPLAAIVGMPACKAQPELTVKVNFEQVRNITKWITKDQMLLVPNTNSQYGSSTEIITEESPFKPLSLYQDTFSPVSGFEDYELWLKLSPNIKFYNLQEPLLDRRIEKRRENQSIQKLAFIKTFIKQVLGYDLDEVTEQVLHYLIDNDSNTFNTKSITNAIQPIKERYIEYLKQNGNEMFSKAFDRELAYQIRRRNLKEKNPLSLKKITDYIKHKLS
jgi:hypothetical protein